MSLMFLEEIGDIFWYIAIGFNELYGDKIPDFNIENYINVADNYSNERFMLKLNILSGELLDLSKKTMFYGKVLNRDKIREIISQLFVVLLSFSYKLTDNLKAWESITMTNIEKT